MLIGLTELAPSPPLFRISLHVLSGSLLRCEHKVFDLKLLVGKFFVEPRHELLADRRRSCHNPRHAAVRRAQNHPLVVLEVNINDVVGRTKRLELRKLNGQHGVIVCVYLVLSDDLNRLPVAQCLCDLVQVAVFQRVGYVRVLEALLQKVR
jgi:hypothetical protein